MLQKPLGGNDEKLSNLQWTRGLVSYNLGFSHSDIPDDEGRHNSLSEYSYIAHSARKGWIDRHGLKSSPLSEGAMTKAQSRHSSQIRAKVATD